MRSKNVKSLKETYILGLVLGQYSILHVVLCYQDIHEAEGPVVEKIMGIRSAKKQVGCTS